MVCLLAWIETKQEHSTGIAVDPLPPATCGGETRALSPSIVGDSAHRAGPRPRYPHTQAHAQARVPWERMAR